MDMIKSDLQEGPKLEKLRGLLSKELGILAISKEELTQANVEPFKIELIDPSPSFERALRYNPTLTHFITREVQALLDKGLDRKSTRLNSSHSGESRMPSSA